MVNNDHKNQYNALLLQKLTKQSNTVLSRLLKGIVVSFLLTVSGYIDGIHISTLSKKSSHQLESVFEDSLLGGRNERVA